MLAGGGAKIMASLGLSLLVVAGRGRSHDLVIPLENKLKFDAEFKLLCHMLFKSTIQITLF